MSGWGATLAHGNVVCALSDEHRRTGPVRELREVAGRIVESTFTSARRALMSQQHSRAVDVLPGQRFMQTCPR